MVEWTDFYLVLLLEFCWTLCANHPAKCLGRAPRAARATQSPPGRCTSLFWDTTTENSSSRPPPPPSS